MVSFTTPLQGMRHILFRKSLATLSTPADVCRLYTRVRIEEVDGPSPLLSWGCNPP